MCEYGGSRQYMCMNKECQVCFNNSFALHPRAKFWNEKNILQPWQVFPSTPNKYWFKCDKCPHSFQSKIAGVVRGKWCGYCSSPPKMLCDDPNCDHCFKMSVERSTFWHKDNKLSPRQIFKRAKDKYYFWCICGHTIIMMLSSITNGSWCKYRARMELCDNDQCEFCRKNSFQDSPFVGLWDYNKNDLSPRQVMKTSSKLFSFICENGHFFISKPRCICCNKCNKTTEQKVCDFLETMSDFRIIQQKTFSCIRKT